jgi:3-methyladenine DNA glycosylase AlkD
VNQHHQEILKIIISLSGNPTQHTFSDSYLGNSHPRYPINAPTLRTVAKEWMKEHKSLSANDFKSLLTSLVKGKSSTEKVMAGILLDASTKDQRKFDPHVFDQWLDHLEGWAEVDSVCTGQYTITEIPTNFKSWKKILIDFSKSKNINKRRASLALLCSPTRKVYDAEIASTAFQIIKRLKKEKPILITKAISWLLRSMVKLYKKEVEQFVNEHEEGLPKIAVRETRVVLLTGKKTNKV